MLRSTARTFLFLLTVSSVLGFMTSYFPGVWGEPIGFWVSDLIATLSYFTIISNLLIAVKCVTQLTRPASSMGLWFTSAPVETALAVYITITGLVYHLLLASTWNPTGIDKVSDVLLHTITPILYVVFWWLGVRGKVFPFKRTLTVLILPAVFLLYWLMRGPMIGSYPYFFMDVAELGVIVVTINMIALCVLFWLTAVIYWALNRYTTPLYV